jgi:hypothetical protein
MRWISCHHLYPQGQLQSIRRPVRNYCALPPVYIVYWYICLTLNRVKVHKYFFQFEDYDGICGSTTCDTWNCQLLRLWRQRRRADARQTHMDYLWNKPRRWIFKFMISNWRPYTLSAPCRGTASPVYPFILAWSVLNRPGALIPKNTLLDITAKFPCPAKRCWVVRLNEELLVCQSFALAGWYPVAIEDLS